MNGISTVIICLSLAGLLHCAAGNAAPSLPLRPLAKGAFSGIRGAKQEVLKNADEWEKLWKQHAVTMKPAANIPAVDFAKEMVIAVTLGTKRTGGYSIEITRVEASDQSLRIYVKQTSPPPGAMTIQALTAPFHFVAVPRSDLKPEFVAATADGQK